MNMKKFVNPSNFFLRFLANFVLFYSAALVAMLIIWALGKWDPFYCIIVLVGMSVGMALLRAAISKPGEPFMDSPVFKTKDQ